MIKIICFGKIKEIFLKEAIKEYQKRLSKYTKLEIIELPDIDPAHQDFLTKEEQSLKKILKKSDNLVMLDKEGIMLNTEEFSTFIAKELTLNSNITFLIGSSYGFSQNLQKEVTKKLSFSKLTFPHQLFRVLLLEQIYRSFKIINHETYHK